jgi:hypothetical protein
MLMAECIQAKYQEEVKSDRAEETTVGQEKVVMPVMNEMRMWMMLVIRVFLQVSVCAHAQARRPPTISIRIIRFQFGNMSLARFTL